MTPHDDRPATTPRPSTLPPASPLEVARLSALRHFHILDTPAEAAFDELTALAAELCDVPMALVSLVDEHRQWFKARLGLDVCETSRESSFCAHALGGPELFIVPDAARDTRFRDNPLVTGDPHIRFYAGVPLVVDGGLVLGTLCVLDVIPRELSSVQQSQLHVLARQVVSQLQLRRNIDALASEVAARSLAERALASNQRVFDGVLSHTNVVVYAKDLDGRFILANPALHALLGSDEAVLGRSDYDLFPALAADQFRRHDARIVDTGVAETFAEQLGLPDGTVHDYQSTKFPLLDESGKVYAIAGVSTDVTELARERDAHAEANRAARERQVFSETVVELVNAGVVACDDTGTVVLCNAAQRHLTEVRADETGINTETFSSRVRIVGKDGHELAVQDYPLQRAFAGDELVDLPLKIVRADGSVSDVLVTSRQIVDADGHVLGAVAATTDITHERLVQDQLRDGAAFHDAVLAATPDLIFVTDPRTNQVVWTSGSLTEMLGYTPQDIADLGNSAITTLLHPEDVDRLLAANMHSQDLSDGGTLEIRYRVRHVSGTYRWLARRVTPFNRDKTGAVSQVLAVARDITDVVEVEQRLAEAALHDPLTGLANRTLLGDRLRGALSRSERTGHAICVLFCDLDGFKQINDTAGHPAGDAVLNATAARLLAAVRAEDTVARVGGDEFVIVLEPDLRRAIDQGAVLDPKADALIVAERIRQAVSEPVTFESVTHVVTTSIGITFARAGSDADDVLRDADIAMYKAKKGGRDRYELFDGGLRTGAIERSRVERTLRTIDAVHNGHAGSRSGSSATEPHGQLSVVYQPIFDLGTHTWVGFEALARLNDEYGQPIPPDQFIPVAEETGLIAGLGRYVLDTACEDLTRWHGQYPHARTLGVAVNLSARQAGLANLVEQVTAALTRTGMAAELLTLEVTESVLLEAGRSTMTAITALHHHGVRISIDDFGTGYASLRYLAELPVSSVKVDRSFTALIPHDLTSTTILRAIAGLARDLDLGCIVEGIETEEQLRALPPGVHGQGYLLGRPVSADVIGSELALTARR